MTLTPAARAFLSDLAVASAVWAHRCPAVSFEAAVEWGGLIRAQFLRAMREGFIAEVDGEPCLCPEPETRYRQGVLL